MLLVVDGVAGLGSTVVAAVGMWVLDRRDPGRTFHLRGYRGVHEGDVTFPEWVDRSLLRALLPSIALIIAGGLLGPSAR